MCGIAGICHLDGRPVERETVERMTAAMAHRGPDGQGVWVEGNVGLGHRRLAVIDLSDAAAQPMANEDGSLRLTYNGEIYNFPELRAELEALGHCFASRSDTEVILHGYEEQGIAFVERLNGHFAFGLWDGRRRRLFLARDRFGVKPLYFCQRGDTFLFASEIKALLAHPAARADLDYDALNEYFTFQNLFRYHTLFKGVNLVPAACVRSLDLTKGAAARLDHRVYWDYNFTDRDKEMDAVEAQRETLRLMRQAVRRQLIADVPVGSYLSGGMDSGSVCALASEVVPRLMTFTAGFEMDGVTGVERAYDERREAELIARTFQTEHYEHVINASTIGWSLPRVVFHMEDLRVGMSYSNYYISRLASRFVKVCLSGEGGDELFGGYPWRYYRVFRSVNRDDFIRGYFGYWQRLVPEEQKADLFTEPVRRATDIRDPFETFRRVFLFNERLAYDTPEDHIANAMYFEIKTFLPGLLLVEDRLAMANGLEQRAPFLDNDLVEFAQRLPVRLKLRRLEEMKRVDENEARKVRHYYADHDDGKNVLREAMAELIPAEIIRRRKQGFSSPDESWYRGANLEYVRDLLLTPAAASREFIQPAYVERILHEHCDLRVNHRLLIWSLLCFELWCRMFLRGETPGSLESGPSPRRRTEGLS